MQLNTNAAISVPDAVEEAIRNCVHCGFCNSVCPTYRLSNSELQGPRGRIYLVKEAIEAGQSNEVVDHSLSNCLGCRACETACPSDVGFGKIAEFGRQISATTTGKLGWKERWLLKAMTQPKKFRFWYVIGRLFRWFLPPLLRESLNRKLPPNQTKSRGSNNGNLLLLQGCIQRILTPETVEHLAELLANRNVDFQIHSKENCCGALHRHLSQNEQADDLTNNNLKKFQDSGVETIISSSSGCGMFWKEQVNHSSACSNLPNCLDVSEYLEKFQFDQNTYCKRVVFQSPCTLQHGQRIVKSVERILSQTGYEVLRIDDEDQCCGAAGIYSLQHPTHAKEIRSKKIAAIERTNPDVVVTANIACQLHLEAALNTPVRHWIQLLS